MDDPRSRAARVERSLAHSDRIADGLTQLAAEPPRPTSSIAAVLAKFHDQIMAARANGVSAARIAATLRRDGVAFSEAGIRWALRQMIGSAPPKRVPRRGETRERPATSQAVRPPAATTPKPAAPEKRERSAPDVQFHPVKRGEFMPDPDIE
ncbi:MAG: hypothetical protein ACYDDQ_01735 [Vulcanimicrobiaceae bacterium]